LWITRVGIIFFILWRYLNPHKHSWLRPLLAGIELPRLKNCISTIILTASRSRRSEESCAASGRFKLSHNPSQHVIPLLNCRAPLLDVALHARLEKVENRILHLLAVMRLDVKPCECSAKLA
jgi:hypothetical protein